MNEIYFPEELWRDIKLYAGIFDISIKYDVLRNYTKIKKLYFYLRRTPPFSYLPCPFTRQDADISSIYKQLWKIIHENPVYRYENLKILERATWEAPPLSLLEVGAVVAGLLVDDTTYCGVVAAGCTENNLVLHQYASGEIDVKKTMSFVVVKETGDAYYRLDRTQTDTVTIPWDHIVNVLPYTEFTCNLDIFNYVIILQHLPAVIPDFSFTNYNARYADPEKWTKFQEMMSLNDNGELRESCLRCLVSYHFRNRSPYAVEKWNEYKDPNDLEHSFHVACFYKMLFVEPNFVFGSHIFDSVMG